LQNFSASRPPAAERLLAGGGRRARTSRRRRAPRPPELRDVLGLLEHPRLAHGSDPCENGRRAGPVITSDRPVRPKARSIVRNGGCGFQTGRPGGGSGVGAKKNPGKRPPGPVMARRVLNPAVRVLPQCTARGPGCKRIPGAGRVKSAGTVPDFPAACVLSY